MRKTYDNQLKFGSVIIPDIKFDKKSRDELPKILTGLQYIFTNNTTRKEVFDLLESIVPKNVSMRKGRKGMDLWKILVLGVVRLGCNWDYDKLHEMSNSHLSIREMLGHGRGDWEDKYYYELQTIKDNVSLITPEVLEKLNAIVSQAGHKLLGGKKKEELQGSVDSFVVETNVSYPTDNKLLLDCMRKAIVLTSSLSLELKLNGWRKAKYHIKMLKKQSRLISKAKKSRGKDREKKTRDAYADYIKTSQELILRIEQTQEQINALSQTSFITVLKQQETMTWLEKANTQISQIQRRVFEGCVIPHSEKVFSVFETYTRWISKGKAGVMVELGLPVSIFKDQHGFILAYQIMETESDVDVAVPLTKKAKELYPALLSCSYDKGYWSPENQQTLMEIIDNPVLPKKGKLSKSDKARQSSLKFIKRRKKHSAVESSINGLEHSGLDRCPDRGIKGFKRYVGLAVLARNIQTLGSIIVAKEKKRAKRKKRKKAA